MSFTIKKTRDAVLIRDESDRVVLGYQFEKPANSKLAVESACYFHPFTTPKGVVVTDVAPSDHLHHRGIFLAFVEMQGAKKADFWGWGEHAPKKDRKIVNELVSGLEANADSAGFEAVNLWQAEGETLIREELSCKVSRKEMAHILDVQYQLEPKANLTLAQWAFSGFCLRVRNAGKLTSFGPEGEVKLPNPNHMQPKSNWPDARWYAYELELPEGTVTAGVASPAANPPTTWHNHRQTRMINPCIVAPAAVDLKGGKPLKLSYKVVLADGPCDVQGLSRFMT